jgi:protein-S-isoprenylcysteine O-methyltransferase Ste14
VGVLDRPLDPARRARIARVKRIMAPVRAALIVGLLWWITGAHRGDRGPALLVAHLVLFVGITLERLTVPAWVEGWQSDRRSKARLGLAFMLTVGASFAERGRLPLLSPPPTAELALLIAGVLVVVVGMGLRQWAIHTLGAFFTDRARIVDDHRLVQHGLYAHVRHPAYLGLSLVFAGYPLMLGSALGAIACALSLPWALRFRIRTEEEVLARHFGAAWDAYAARTPALWPWARTVRKSN